MSSDCVSSDVEGSPTSPIIPSCWSDSDGRRSAGDGWDGDESPWWKSESETQVVLCVSSDPSPENSDNDIVPSSSSVTPSWWSYPSSRQVSTSGTEVEADEEAADHQLSHCSREERDRARSNGDDESKCSPLVNNRKRSREQSHVSSNTLKEPPVHKLKLESPSPHVNTLSILRNLKRDIFQPLKVFLLFFSVDLLTRICDLTNTHGWETILDDPSIASEDGSWEEITVEEMYAFIAVILIMRRHQDVCFGAFWREQVNERPHWPRALMKRSRFFTILCMLRFAEPVECETAVEKCEGEKLDQPKQNVREEMHNERDIFMKEFKYFLDQVQLVFEIFFHRLEVQCSEEILMRDDSGNRQQFKNYMKILSSPCKSSSDKMCNIGPTKIGGVNFEKSATDVVCCNGTATALKNTEKENSNRAHGANEKSTPKLDNPEQDQKQLDHLSKRSLIKLHSSERGRNETPQLAHSSNMITVIWKDNCFSVSASKDCTYHQAIQSFSLKDKNETSGWQDVFIPCPELVYKDYLTTIGTGKNHDALNSGIGHHAIGGGLSASFFYHYLNLAIYISTDNGVECLPFGSNEMQSDVDSLQQILDGLVLLGKPDSVLQSDSDGDVIEPDTSSNSATTDQSDDDDGDNENKMRYKSHKYIQARSRMRSKCALCWSLHQEVRKVHTRCTRCNRHFCLSRFRNCMGEAHEDEEVMKQLSDEETGDLKSTSGVCDSKASSP